MPENRFPFEAHTHAQQSNQLVVNINDLQQTKKARKLYKIPHKSAQSNYYQIN